MRDRFGIAFRLNYYEPEELAQIITRSAGILDVAISEDGALEIARRSRGTPRLANRLLKRVRDWAQVKGDSIIDEDCAAQALSFFEVDSLGLDAVDNRILEMLCGQFAGAPWVSPRSLQRSLKCLKRSRMSTSLILCNRGCSFVRRKDVRLHGVLSSTLA